MIWGRIGLAAACGSLSFLAAPKFDLWFLAWVAFVPLFLAISQQTTKHAFFLGWIAGIFANFGGFYWIPHLLQRFGHLPKIVAIILFVLLAAYQGVHWGAFAWLIRRTQMSRSELPLVLLAPVYFVSLELLMPFIFDWFFAITQAWVPPVIQVADLTGPLGVSGLLMLVNGMTGDAVLKTIAKQKIPVRPTIFGLSVFAVAMAYGALRISQTDSVRSKAPKLTVGVVQANIGIVEKGRSALAVKHHQIHLQESWALQRKKADLIVWPESSYPFSLRREQTRDFADGDVRQVMRELNVPLLFGALSYSRNEPYPYNTAFMMNPDGEIIGRFDKIFLLIFGEYIPFYEHIPQFKQWIPAASHFARGNKVVAFPFDFQGKRYKIAPLICYEDIIPAFGRKVAALRPNLLVNVTNDAWFGATSEPHEHLALAVFRAVELRLDLVRAVNTGVTSFIDANGRVLAKTQSHDPVETPDVQPEHIAHQMALMPGTPTVYARFGDVFGFLMLAVSAGLLWWSRTGLR